MNEVTLNIILETPTPGVDFGLQKGSGSKYETVQKQKSTGKNLVFECTVKIKEDKNKKWVLSGPFVQGPPDGRFVYIDIGTLAGQTGFSWSRRLKIPLGTITSEMIDKSLSGSVIIETSVPGIGKDGGPNCGSVKPFSGWCLR